MWKGIVLLTIVTSSVVAEEEKLDPQSTIIYENQENLKHIRHHEPEHREKYDWTYPLYRFDYKIEDPHTHDFKGQHELRQHDKVEGVYWLYQPDGRKRTVKYSDDGHTGFVAHVEFSHPHGHHMKLHHKQDEMHNYEHLEKRNHSPKSEYQVTMRHEYTKPVEEPQDEVDTAESESQYLPGISQQIPHYQPHHYQEDPYRYREDQQKYSYPAQNAHQGYIHNNVYPIPYPNPPEGDNIRTLYNLLKNEHQYQNYPGHVYPSYYSGNPQQRPYGYGHQNYPEYPRHQNLDEHRNYAGRSRCCSHNDPHRSYGYNDAYIGDGYNGPHRNHGHNDGYRGDGYNGPNRSYGLNDAYRGYGYNGPNRSYGYNGPYRSYGYNEENRYRPNYQREYVIRNTTDYPYNNSSLGYQDRDRQYVPQELPVP